MYNQAHKQGVDYMNKKIIVTAASILIVLSGGAAVVATRQGIKPVEDSKVSTNIQTTGDPNATAEGKPLEMVNTPMVPEPVAPPPVTEVAPPPAPDAPPAAPVVKTFGELILNYPAMTDTPLKVECLNRIHTGWPERFQDHNREANVALLARTMANPCAFLYRGNELLSVRPFPMMEDHGSGDWFTRYNGQ